MRSMLRSAVEKVLVRLPRRARGGDRLILAYHNVVPNEWMPCGDRSLHLPVAQFEAQLDALRAELPVVPLIELLTTADPDAPRVAITFDDAYASALALGVGACQARHMPCTVFVAPGLLGRVPPWDWRALSGTWSTAERETFLWQQAGRPALENEPSNTTAHATLRIASLDELKDAIARHPHGLTIGNHTASHPNLSAIPRPAVELEVREAQRWLLRHVPQQTIPVIAYPYGLAPRDHSWRHGTDDVNVPDWGLIATGAWLRSGAPVDRHAVARWNVPAGVSTAGFLSRIRGQTLFHYYMQLANGASHKRFPLHATHSRCR
jgi:peptidoglycan/xylan/chitin deacetylase (PgdA/CDA1 family)